MKHKRLCLTLGGALLLCQPIRGNFRRLCYGQVTVQRNGRKETYQTMGISLFAWSPWLTLTVSVSQTMLTMGLSILNCIANYIAE